MEIEAIVGEMIGMLSVGGGLCLGAYAIFVGGKERQQRLENISKERLLLIEKGMDPALAYQRQNGKTGAGALFWGLTLAGVGLGLLTGAQMARSFGMDEDKVTFASAAFFGGIGMVIYYFYNAKRNAQKTG
jgi:hypothetical protein